jgi:hypothetical protein
MKQTTFASMADDTQNKRTRHEQFLAGIKAVIPWLRLVKLSEPHDPVVV